MMVMITTDEYKELVLKADKYDKLREKCVTGTFATTEEEILFDITEKEKKAMEERRQQ
jgi:hypothetical protein